MADPIDYSDIFVRLADGTKSISEAITALQAAHAKDAAGIIEAIGQVASKLGEANDIAREVLENQKDFVKRASTDMTDAINSNGIYMRSGNNDGGFNRAMSVNALKQSNQLENVRQEMANPTPI